MTPIPLRCTVRRPPVTGSVTHWRRVFVGALLCPGLAAGPLTGAVAAAPKPAAAASARADAAALPEVNLRIDWRQVDEAVLDESHRAGEAVVVGTHGGTTVAGGRQWSTERRGGGEFGLHGVQVQLRNGGSAQLQWQRDVPVEWVAQALLPSGTSAGSISTSAGAVAGSGSPGAIRGISQQLVWLTSGQQLALHARWPGGAKPVTVDLDIAERSLEPATTGSLQQPVRHRLESTVVAPLGAWVTLARSAAPAEGDIALPVAGSLSTLALRPPRSLLQLRVSVIGRP